TLPPALHHGFRRRAETGPVFLLTLAGILSAAMVTAAVPLPWGRAVPALPEVSQASQGHVTAGALFWGRTPEASSGETPAHGPVPDFAARADMLAGVVA